MSFSLEQVFGVEWDPQAAILGSVDSVAVDDIGRVYVVDTQSHAIVAFTADGEVAWRADSYGGGPAELDTPRGVVWDGGSVLYVANHKGTQLDAWRTSGEFVRAWSLSEVRGYLRRVVGIIGEQKLVLAGSRGDLAGALVTIVDIADPSSVETRFTVDVAESNPEGHAVLAPVMVAGEMIVVGDFDSYDIRFFDVEGKLVRIVSREGIPLPGFGTSTSGRSWNLYSWVHAPVQLPTGELLVVASSARGVDDPDAVMTRTELGQPAKVEWAWSFDLFDQAGGYLFSHAVDDEAEDPGQLAIVGPDGRLYTLVGEPFPHVRRYRVDLARK